MFPLASNQQSKTYVEDVFSAYTYAGNSSAQTITNGIDLAGKGGMVWLKDRSFSGFYNYLQDTARGAGNSLYSNDTLAQASEPTTISSFGSSGFSLGSNGGTNQAGGHNYVSWTFRNARNFFQVLSVTKTAGSNKVIDLSPYMSTVGMVKVKRTDSTGSWYVWHRSLTAGKLLIGETTAAETTLGQITVSGTTLTLVDGVIADGTYHIEAYAHDTSADGMIQCGSWTASASAQLISLGWEPQDLWHKRIDSTGNWDMFDTARGWVNGFPNQAYLRSNLSNAEVTAGGITYPVANGFMAVDSASAPGTYIFTAIRRGPMRKPTSGAQVYNAIARTGTGAAATVTGVGFPPDLGIFTSNDSTRTKTFIDRLRGPSQQISSNTTLAESAVATGVTSFDMDGVSVSNAGSVNATGEGIIDWFFRRYPGVFDIVPYKGTGSARTIDHNLKVAPELIVIKPRSAVGEWIVYHAALGASKLAYLNRTDAAPTVGTDWWVATAPTNSVFSIGTNGSVNNTGSDFISYLFATLAGISKVFSVTKVSGVNKDVDCGFVAGARFVLLKSTGTGGWYLWDSVRGIVAGNDPYLLLNSTAAEVTSTDYIDPYAAGFTIVDGGLPNGDYIGVSFA